MMSKRPEGNVIVRSALVGIASVALAIAAFAAPAGARAIKADRKPAVRATLAAAPRAGWSITQSPNPRARNGFLVGVSCPTTSVCTAVGFYVQASGRGVVLAEQRHGDVWRVQSTPDPARAASSGLNAVSCSSGSACTAVGQFTVGSGKTLTLAERWDGRSWHIQHTPNPSASPSSRLFAVTCPAADSCTAVGAANSQVLVERWDGVRWHIQPAAVPPGAQFSELNGISCLGSWCMAAGDYVNSSGVDVTLAESWDASSWSIQPSPNPAAAQSLSALTGVSCTAPDACEASGSYDSGMFAEAWNGTSWSLQTTPAPAGAQFAQLYYVSCAASSCEAAGGYVNSSGAYIPLNERWDGTAWQAQPTPDPARASTNGLSGVSCASASDCTAVGVGNGDGTPFALAERFQSGHWRLDNAPSPVGAAENQLNGISCPDVHHCVAVGTVGPTRGVWSPEALAWSGRTWHPQRMPAVPGTILNAVTCASKADCVAVGSSDSGTLAEHWNGERWAIQRTRNPARSQGASLNAISCSNAVNCMAVGGYMDAKGRLNVLAERWSGHKWHLVPAPAPSSSPNSFLVGVDCSAPSACIGVGGSFDAQMNSIGTVTEQWNGSRWTVQRTPTRHTPGAFLAGVWCKPVTACVAVGNTAIGTLAERLSRGKWRVEHTPNPPGTAGDFFNNVSCTSLSACTAVGMAFGPGGFPPQTLAERTDGAHWRIQPTPVLPGIGDLSNFFVSCPSRSRCVAAGGFENDGPSAKSLIEQWRALVHIGVPAARVASSPHNYLGVLGCVRTAIGEGTASKAEAAHIGFEAMAPMLRRTQSVSLIKRITSLCAAA
jgi:hypothetical protein